MGHYPPGCNSVQSPLTVTILNTWFDSALRQHLSLLQKQNKITTDTPAKNF